MVLRHLGLQPCCPDEHGASSASSRIGAGALGLVGEMASRTASPPQLDLELVANFVASMEKMRPTDGGAMPKVLELLDTVVAPVLAEAAAGKG